MQPPLQDPFAIPRRALDMEDYIDILRRHRGWVLGPLFAAIVVTTVVAFLWPDTYVSKATIRVTPPQIPDRLVQTTVTAEMNQRVNSMAQAILSRTQLTNMINSYNLYPKDRRRLPMEDVIETMKKDVKIGLVGALPGAGGGGDQKVNAFQVTFSYDNRIVAQKVCQELVSRFIDENIRFRTSQTVQTVEFMKDQVEERKRKLDEIDRRLTEFRVANAGRLPEQVQNNASALNALENRLGNLNMAVARSKQDQLILESQLQSLRDNMRFVSRPIQQQIEQQAVAVKSDRLLSLERDVQALEAKLQGFMEVYVETHPDVVNLKSQLALARRMRDQQAKDDGDRKAPPDSTQGRLIAQIQQNQAKEQQEIQNRINQTQSLIEAKKLESESLLRDLMAGQRQARDIEARMTATPLGEAKYDELMRERSSAKAAYEEIQVKSLSSEMGKKIEDRKQGELLEVLDPASLPQSPTQPVRSLIIGAGAGAGLIIGLLVAAAREMKDSTLKNLKDVRAYTQLTVLGSVPLLENDLVVRRRRRLAWLAWSTACLAGCMIMAGSVVFYLTTKG